MTLVPDPTARLANLVVAGFPRTGTTWLYEVFSRHPQIFVPHRKELHYFDNEGERSLGWYADYFRPAKDQPWLADITPGYVLDPAIAARIRSVLPDARIVIVLRDPVTWLYSWYKLKHRAGRIRRTFDTVLKADGFLPGMAYAPKLEAYFHAFPAAQLYVRLYEDLESAPGAYLGELLDWLGVESSSFVERESDLVGTRTNAAVVPSAPAAHRALHRMVRKGRKLHLRPVDALLDAGRDAYRRFFVRPGRDAVSPHARQVIREFYRDDARQVQRLTGLDVVSRWKLESAE